MKLSLEDSPFYCNGNSEVNVGCERDLCQGQSPGHQVIIDTGGQVSLTELGQTED